MGIHFGNRPTGNVRFTDRDPFFNQTTLLLNGNGTNGAQNNTFLDSSPNNFTITRNGNTTQGTFTPFSQPQGYWSNYFNGTNSGLSVANNAALQFGTGAFTIEGWFYFPTLSVTQIIFEQRSFAVLQTGVFYTTTAGKPAAYFQGVPSSGSNIDITFNTTLSTNTWYHLAFVRNGNTLSCYINGVAEATTGNLTNYNNTTSVNQIGYSSFSGSIYTTGYFSSFRIVKGTAVYTGNFTPPTAPLTAITNTSLLTCQDNRFIDNSTNAFAITRNGDVRVTAFSPFAPTAAYSAATNGGSGYFDGTGDYLTFADAAALELSNNNFCIEFWINTTSSSQYDTIFAREPSAVSAAGYFSLLINSASATAGDVAFWCWDFNSFSAAMMVTTGASIRDGAWHHVAVVRNGSSWAIYIDGVSRATATSSITIADINASYWIGNNQAQTSRDFPGYLSDFRIVVGSAVYTAAFTSPTAPLTAITNTSLLLNFTNAGIIDSTAKNVLETVGNAQIDTTVKKYGTGAMEFDGNGDYILMPDVLTGQFLTGDFTVEYWDRHGSQNTNYATQVGTLSSSTPSGTWRFGTVTNNGGVYLDYHNGTSYISLQFGTTLYNDNTWRHFALTRQNGIVRAFVDGIQVGTNQTVTQNFNSSNRVILGAELVNPTYFNGFIDDLRITKGVARYTSNFTPPFREFFRR